tara:strand:+ start:87 stop:266 length:180 start_codon:yes stop_codon:yes gene_type:complete
VAAEYGEGYAAPLNPTHTVGRSLFSLTPAFVVQYLLWSTLPKLRDYSAGLFDIRFMIGV